MNTVLHQQLNKITDSLSVNGNKLPELKPLFNRLRDNLLQFQQHKIDFEELKTTCLADFRNTNLYQHPSLQHATAHHVAEEIIRQFFHLNALIIALSTGKHPVSHQRPSSLLFTQPEDPADLVARLAELLAQFNELANN